ncbi:hypothetical protein D3C87_1946100 [compost metagenome]
MGSVSVKLMLLSEAAEVRVNWEPSNLPLNWLSVPGQKTTGLTRVAPIERRSSRFTTAPRSTPEPRLLAARLLSWVLTALA